jgi:hypothetical protein
MLLLGEFRLICLCFKVCIGTLNVFFIVYRVVYRRRGREVKDESLLLLFLSTVFNSSSFRIKIYEILNRSFEGGSFISH